MKRLLAVFVCLMVGGTLAAQVPLPGLPRGIAARIPTLSSLVAGQPLTTSVDDAVGSLPMLDDYAPAAFGSQTHHVQGVRGHGLGLVCH